MPRVSAAFFAAATLFILAGMGLGIFMGVEEDFSLAPVHAHINLLGWATLALYGAFYGLNRQAYSPRLAWMHFILSTSGAVIMPLGLGLLLDTGNHAVYGPLTGIGGVFSLAGLLIFAWSVCRVLVRPSPEFRLASHAVPEYRGAGA